MPFKVFMHHIDFCSIFFLCKLAVCPLFFFCFVPLLFVLVLILAPCLGKLELIGPLPLLPLGVTCLGMISAEKPLIL